MEITIEALQELIKDMDPTMKISVGGGHVDYVTDDVEIVESNGCLMFQESSAVKTERYDIVDLAGQNFPYDKLVVYTTYQGTLSDVCSLFDDSFSGTILVDTLFHAGNSANRFVRATVTNGVVDRKSFECVPARRRDAIRVFSNDHIRRHPERLDASVLTDIEKKLLLRGLSI